MQPVWIVKKFALLMPWIFLALRRALIPSMCCAILVFVFFAVPQSGEVLHGLIARDFVTGPFRDRTPPLIVKPLLWYVVTSVTLAFAIWYSARLLCTVHFRMSLPAAWRPKYQLLTNRQIMNAVSWLPRSLGILALGACMGALAYANYRHFLSGSGTAALVGLSFAAPLVMAGVLLKLCLNGRLHWSRRAVGPAIALYAISVLSLAVTGAPLRVQIVTVLTALLPADMLMILVMRRVEINGSETRSARHVCFLIALALAALIPGGMLLVLVMSPNIIRGSLDKARVRPNDIGLGDVIGRVLVFILLGVVSLFILATLSSGAARAFGSASAIILFLAALVMLLTGVQLTLRWLTQCVPGFTTGLVLILVVPAGMLANSYIGREAFGTNRATPAGNAQTAQPAHAMLVSQKPLVMPQHDPDDPVLFISAFGGGLRAAIFTAELLALADDSSCGKFGEHIVATSTVSGGSLGMATYLVARQALLESAQMMHTTPWSGCRAGAVPTATPLFDTVRDALFGDHLSAAIATGVSRDLLPILQPHRGMALLASWNDALRSAIRDNERNKQGTPRAFEMPLERLTGGLKIRPTVYFNATDSKHGSIVWFSNAVGDQPGCEFGSVPNMQPGPRLCDGLTVGQAVLHSARFPVITPPGAYPLDKTQAVLVDGGYADNSGGQTLSHQVGWERLQAPNASLLEINGNPPESSNDCPDHAHESALPTALKTLLLSRSARAELAAALLLEVIQPCPNGDDHPSHCAIQATLDPERVLSNRLNERGEPYTNDQLCELSSHTQIPSLGWYTGADAAALITESVRMQVPAVCRLLALDCRVPEVDGADVERRVGTATATVHAQN
jgi:hypothetical protein